jgi:hypothetical protein
MLNREVFDYFSHYQKENPTQRIYGLFDGVKYPMLWSDLEGGILGYDMLFKEEALREKLIEVAPYLVRLDFEGDMAIEESQNIFACYGENGAIFMASQFDFEDVLSAMRELFYVYTTEGEEGYMRFYEPKIFRHYIIQKNANIQYALFSHITSYWCEEKEEEKLAHYRYDGKHVRRNYVTLPKETP